MTLRTGAIAAKTTLPWKIGCDLRLLIGVRRATALLSPQFELIRNQYEWAVRDYGEVLRLASGLAFARHNRRLAYHVKAGMN